MNCKWLDRCLIISPVYYTLATSQMILDREIKKLNGPPFSGVKPGSGATTNFLENEKGKPVAIVCLFDHSHSVEKIYALLAHEAVHIWQEIRKDIGEESPSAEFEAYSIQRICQELFYEYSRQRKKRKGK